ncbi:hypothetical protein TCAL_13147 [Tigriopus californicus]|uniref:Uncharacterized protein n=1 Tax=Tigriopus californicus TaxID=6832 RepID=A0A553N766_TIGCA|nr:uncharacterized protein LOC131884938 [Tigriopus californicus]TRY61282.1 hypothetical protein TCAL_13147 [Tigriopus californicus]|eukprot:TCALIF_13147-PA protein Name:"Protein of unknown function" AED:0.00 eAED:0.00 QI:20/1/1/1/1/1/2/144/149
MKELVLLVVLIGLRFSLANPFADQLYGSQQATNRLANMKPRIGIDPEGTEPFRPRVSAQSNANSMEVALRRPVGIQWQQLRHFFVTDPSWTRSHSTFKRFEPPSDWRRPNEEDEERRAGFFLKRTNDLSPFRLRKRTLPSDLSPFRLRK